MGKRFCLWMAAVLAALALTACGGGAVPAVDVQRMNELGSEFISDINAQFLPSRESEEELRELDAVVVTSEKTYNIAGLYAFYDEYRMGGDARMTTVFKTKTFVVTRLVFEDGAGYYFRYEYDSFNKAEIVISSQAVDKVEVKEDARLDKVEMTLSKDKKTPIVLTYRNIAGAEENG